MSIDSTYKFADQWGDTRSKQRLKASKGPEVERLEIENHLKGMSLRFERSPNAATLGLWASDMVDAGYKDWMVREVCITAPFKFERHPTLSQLMDLLRSYLPHVSISTDELSNLSNRCYPHLKAKFLALTSQEILETMCLAYKKHVGAAFYKDVEYWHSESLEKAVLNDWLRTYFDKSPQKIIDQGKISNDKAASNDREYFTYHLKSYAQEHGL